MRIHAFFTVIILLFVFGCGAPREESSYEGAANEDTSFVEQDTLIPSLLKEFDTNIDLPKDKKFVKTIDLGFEVKNVLHVSERINYLSKACGGYLIHSEISNNQDNSTRTNYTRDSILIIKEMLVKNYLTIRIPVEKVDSFVALLNPLVVTIDKRTINLEDVTFTDIENKLKSITLTKSIDKQQEDIASKGNKLKDITRADELLLNRRMLEIENLIERLRLEDKIQFCEVSIEIYQKPIIVKEIVVDIDYVKRLRPNFFIQLWDSIVEGIWIVEKVFLFVVKLWGVALLIVLSIVGVKKIMLYFNSKNKK